MAARIRPAVPGDGPALAGLIAALAEYERLPGPDAAAGACLESGLSANPPHYLAWIAERDGEPVGYALAFPTYSTFLARVGLYLEDLFVLPGERGRGTGKALFLAVAREARARGCGRLEWAVLDWNKPSIDFYERLGARHNAGWLQYRLDEAALAALEADEVTD